VPPVTTGHHGKGVHETEIEGGGIGGNGALRRVEFSLKGSVLS
jgi:hypothetical protein